MVDTLSRVAASLCVHTASSSFEAKRCRFLISPVAPDGCAFKRFCALCIRFGATTATLSVVWMFGGGNWKSRTVFGCQPSLLNVRALMCAFGRTYVELGKIRCVFLHKVTKQTSTTKLSCLPVFEDSRALNSTSPVVLHSLFPYIIVKDRSSMPEAGTDVVGTRSAPSANDDKPSYHTLSLRDQVVLVTGPQTD